MINRRISELVYFLKARLSRQISLWVFLSIVVIEIVILFPSYARRERELLMQLEDISQSSIDSIVRITKQEMSDNFEGKIKTLTKNSIVLGVTVYDRNGNLIESIGELPNLKFKDLKNADRVRYYNWYKKRYDIALSPEKIGVNYILIVRHDATMVQKELNAFVLRIIGLVLIISIFVSGATMIILGVMVILPILRLREDLIKAGEALGNNGENFKFYACSMIAAKRKDELGDVMLAFIQMFDRLKLAETMMLREQQKSESLLLKILPAPIAQKLKNGEVNIAQEFAEVTILFADLVNFTQLSSQIGPEDLLKLLNQIFSQFDELTEKYGLEKIKTIGDNYMVASGVPIARFDHAEAAAEMALDMQMIISQFMPIFNHTLSIRIGMNTGPVVAGVIGIKKFIYDLWGDTVNTASRMESHGLPGKIQITEATYLKLKDKYLCEYRGKIEIKGKGEMITYWLFDRM